jgi:hypothetical protein
LLSIKSFPNAKSYAAQVDAALFKGDILNTPRTSACLLAGALLLTSCGGGSATQGTCALGSPAGCGGTLSGTDATSPPAGAPTTQPDPATSVAAVELVASSSQLPSSGQDGTEVTLTALVKNDGNVAVSAVPVAFSADSGLLSVTNATSDASGKASAKLAIGSSKANRPITVTATVAGKRASAVVNVTGTRLVFNAPGWIPADSSASLTATLLDSAGLPIAGQAVTASTKLGNRVTVAAPSDANGQVALQVDASARGNEEITLSALGASVTRTVAVGGGEVSLSPAVRVDYSGNQVLAEAAVGACSPIDGSTTDSAASVMLNASRGTLYTDAACTQALTGSLPVTNGSFQRSYIKSDNAGVSTIDATLSNGAQGSTSLEFVAPLAPTSWLALQPDLAVIGSGERSTLSAVVRDGTAANNLVKGATVLFSIVSDPSGGTLLEPFSAVTGSDGQAHAVFVAGPGDSARNGTVIQARVASLPGASATSALTVNKKALSIQFGTGNQLVVVSDTVLQQNFAVFVADSAGNPVPNVTISAAAWPTTYIKGGTDWVPDDPNGPLEPGRWEHHASAICANEDVLRNGLYQRAFDINGNGLLDPGIPLTVTSSGKTDAMGLANVALRYPRDHAGWVTVELTVTGAVAGTESMARNTFMLAGLAEDYTKHSVPPPGVVSPYGVAGTCSSPY